MCYKVENKTTCPAANQLEYPAGNAICRSSDKKVAIFRFCAFEDACCGGSENSESCCKMVVMEQRFFKPSGKDERNQRSIYCMYGECDEIEYF